MAKQLYTYSAYSSHLSAPLLRLLCVFRSLALLVVAAATLDAAVVVCLCVVGTTVVVVGVGGSSVARAALVARAWATTSVYDNRLRTASTSSRRGHFNYKFMEERAANS